MILLSSVLYKTIMRIFSILSDTNRICPVLQLEACVHSFFDELRDPNTRLPNGRPLPPLFNFKPQGMNFCAGWIDF